LYGERYITYYAPIKDATGKVAGLSFIGLPVDQATQTLFDALEEIKWGDTGYTIIVDNDENNLGKYLLHPAKSGSDSSIL
ncbi:Cache 3/Cache 2 fusion domain-containing protein, partial [Escherichia coli]|nr:Cache 3/Cache 2 fusion domain-containing protein [Escherichia coli]